MAQGNVAVPANAWTKIIDNAADAVTFQQLTNYPCYLVATAADVAPSNLDGALQYNARQGEVGRTLEELFPGVTGAAYLWVYSNGGATFAFSHA